MPINLNAHAGRDEEARIEIVPLIDIMFFLLAAMMLVSLGAVRLKLLKADLPVAVAGKPAKATPPLALSVDKEGFLRLDGKPLALGEAVAVLRRAAEANPEVRLVVAADRATRHEHVLRAVDLARAAGIDRVAFAAKAAE